jgi:hypothetical protein
MGARRIRSIKPEILEDEKAEALSDRAWRLFVSTWCLADDEGRFRASASYLAGQVFPSKRLSTDQVDGALAELVDAGMLHVYAHKGQRYGCVANWTKHQRIDRPKPSHLPAFGDPQSAVAIIRDESRQVHADRDQGSGILDPGSGTREPPGSGAHAPSALAAGSTEPRIGPEAPETQPRANVRQRTAPSTEALEVAEYLRAAISSHNPGHRAGAVAVETWARDIDLAIRRDGRSVSDLRLVIDFAHRSPDPFWRGNLLSGAKLREKFDALLIQLRTRNGNGQRRRSAAERLAIADALDRGDGWVS